MERKRGAWTIKSSEKIYADEFVEFRLDEVLKPNGEPGRIADCGMRI